MTGRETQAMGALPAETAYSEGTAGSRAEQKRQHESLKLAEAIEEDSVAIARLLMACGSSLNFGRDELREFERLIRHRRRLTTRLERLRRAARSALRV
jgi:hypothetical protein